MHRRGERTMLSWPTCSELYPYFQSDEFKLCLAPYIYVSLRCLLMSLFNFLDAAPSFQRRNRENVEKRNRKRTNRFARMSASFQRESQYMYI